ncbi:hypothetical protein MN608_05317 [Microdochium nivale]|nr:hypothetical protein MN608_05317 [Microdochium nivale]
MPQTLNMQHVPYYEGGFQASCVRRRRTRYESPAHRCLCYPKILSPEQSVLSFFYGDMRDISLCTLSVLLQQIYEPYRLKPHRAPLSSTRPVKCSSSNDSPRRNIVPPRRCHIRISFVHHQGNQAQMSYKPR